MKLSRQIFFLTWICLIVIQPVVTAAAEKTTVKSARSVSGTFDYRVQKVTSYEVDYFNYKSDGDACQVKWADQKTPVRPKAENCRLINAAISASAAEHFHFSDDVLNNTKRIYFQIEARAGEREYKLFIMSNGVRSCDYKGKCSDPSGQLDREIIELIQKSI